MMRYLYSLLRYTPSPANGEFVNLAAVAVSDEAGDHALRHVENDSRAKGLGTASGVSAFYTFLGQMSQQIDALSDDGLVGGLTAEQWLQDLASHSRHIVQLSPPTPMLADSAEDALDLIFDQLIVDPLKITRTFVTRSRAISALRSGYRSLGADPLNVRPSVRLETGRVSSPMDFAVANGSVLALAHAWSFAVGNQNELARDIKSWGWSIGELRDQGGMVRSGTGEPLTVDRNVPVDVLYVPPLQDADAEAFGEAQQVFEELGVEARPLASALDVVNRARDLLEGHGVVLAPLG